jgi:hypothetical protein
LTKDTSSCLWYPINCPQMRLSFHPCSVCLLQAQWRSMNHAEINQMCLEIESNHNYLQYIINRLIHILTTHTSHVTAENEKNFYKDGIVVEVVSRCSCREFTS